MLRTAAFFLAVLLLGPVATVPQAQGTAPAAPFTLLSREGRRPVPTTILNGQELIALDDLATLFQVTTREDAGGLTLTYRGRSAVLSQEQPMASVNGRVVSLPSAPVRAGRRWLLPLDVIPRALAQIYDARIELRRPSRLLIVGDVRVPRVTARMDSAGPPTRATLEVAPAASAAVAVEGGRITVRIDADAVDLVAPPPGSGLIDSFRAGDQPSSVVIVLSPRYATARAVPTTADNVTRIAVEVAAAAAPGDAAAPEAPPTPASPLPAAAGSVVEAIVIDPGHGGDDAGVRGAGGLLEKQVTLEVARRLKSLIETRIGLRVIMTRDDDRALSLDERAAIANNAKADLFVSLHMNGTLSRDIRGAEVSALRLDRDGEAARAAAEQAVSLPVFGGGARTIDVVRWDLAQVRHVDASALFASMLEEELRKHVPMGPRPLQQQPLRVLAGVDMPAALVEMGYLSNGDQEKAAQANDFQAGVAQAVFDAVVRMRAALDEGRAR